MSEEEEKWSGSENNCAKLQCHIRIKNGGYTAPSTYGVVLIVS